MPESESPDVGYFRAHKKDIVAVLGLGALAATATALHVGDPAWHQTEYQQAFWDSARHPAVGYVGARAVQVLTRSRSFGNGIALAIAGGLVANFGAEFAQDQYIYDAGINFYTNTGETMKDATFALGGVSIAVANNLKRVFSGFRSDDIPNFLQKH